MTKKAPGKSEREGLTLLQVADMFGNNNKARLWLEEQRWPEGPHCPHCGSFNIKVGVPHKSMTHRCNDCPKKPMFTVKVGSVMQGSKLSYRIWAIGIYLFTTNLKGISSMRLHRELGITQKAAWFMLHRLREACNSEVEPFNGPVEVDETSTVYTDEARAYIGLGRYHEAVRHSVGEYVRGQAHTNGIESFWSGMKRGFDGVYHKMSPKHLDRYVSENSNRHNARSLNTVDQMGDVVKGMSKKRLRYVDLIADNGLCSGARV